MARIKRRLPIVRVEKSTNSLPQQKRVDNQTVKKHSTRQKRVVKQKRAPIVRATKPKPSLPPRHQKRVANQKPPRQLLNKDDKESFGRREAATVLRTVLQGDSERQAVGSIKTLVYDPSVRNKRATLRLVCQTLKHLPVIKAVLDNANVLTAKWKEREELFYIITYEVLFGQASSLTGDAEKFLLLRKDSLESALKQLLVKKKATTVQDLLPHQTAGVQKPCYVRVNTLKLDMDSAIKELGKLYKGPKALEEIFPQNPGMPDCRHFLETQGCKFGDKCKYNHPKDNTGPALPQRSSEPPCEFYMKTGICSYGLVCKFHHPIGQVEKDDLVPHLLILPPGTDLHAHPLVKDGSVFLQGKASSMVAIALAPRPGWKVLDACAAPGNKTVHVAALMGRKGKVFACEMDKGRITRLKETVRLSGASNVKVLNDDFLSLNPEDAPYSEVNAILLDPSCSGSGTASSRLDNLLPSYAEGHADDEERLIKLSSFQKMALEHALSFPKVERIVYSTCSIHQIENEDVVSSVLPFAASNGFRLETPFPQWPRRGLPVFDGSEHLLRTDPVEDKEGFFIAVFVRKLMTIDIDHSDAMAVEVDCSDALSSGRDSRRVRRKVTNPFIFPTRLSKVLLH